MSLTTLAEAKSYMDVKTSAHDLEIVRLCAASLGVVENLAGPALVRRTFAAERYTASGSTLLLRRYPVVSVTSVGSLNSLGAITLAQSGFYVIDGNRIASPYGYGTVEVTYVAGLPAVPDEAVDAALIYVSYKYRRNHGGSESYMPAGVDGGIAPPMGVDALHRQIALALGGYAAVAGIA